MLLAAFTAMNVMSWWWTMQSETSQMHFILSHLEMSEISIGGNKEERMDKALHFINNYLGSDGMLVLHLVAQHADVVFSSELIAQLWTSFVNVEQQRQSVIL